MSVCRLQVLQKPQVAASLSGPSHFWRCCYGSHPRSLVLAEHSGISLGDFRVCETAGGFTMITVMDALFALRCFAFLVHMCMS